MEIRKALPADGDTLFDLWLRSVRATHSFVSAEDLEAMMPQVRAYLSAADSGLWVAHDADRILGFMGLSGSKMDSLFLDPASHGRGIGRRLVEFATSLSPDLAVDVNEQNDAARKFYEACGFAVQGRSPLDEQGRPYPILHLRLTRQL